MLASVVVRTYNEEKYLDQLLSAVRRQSCESINFEVVIVDSGSTDNTLHIAEKYNCRIVHIKKSDFTFGRSLNVGCEVAKGDILVFVSGHCIPVDEHWLGELCKPLVDKTISYSYGRQRGKDTTRFSEYRHFDKWFPAYSKLPQEGYFCNNANAALTRDAWKMFGFDESLPGLEDMWLAKQLVEDNQKIGYVATACVYHIHDETWRQVRIRYEREAYALQQIMPQVHFSYSDFIRFFTASILSDFGVSLEKKALLSEFSSIVLFRFNQYWGTYKGNRQVRKLSNELKYRYFYPADVEKNNYEP